MAYLASEPCPQGPLVELSRVVGHRIVEALQNSGDLHDECDSANSQSTCNTTRCQQLVGEEVG